MKRIIFLILLFSTSFLLANEQLDSFIDEQIRIEAKLLDNNTSIDKKMEIKQSQNADYRDFFFQYAADWHKHISEKDPYKNTIYKLQLRKTTNERIGNKNAALRDELLLKNYTLKQNIRNGLNYVLKLSDNNSKDFFKDKINELLTKYFSTYKPIDKKRYTHDTNNTENHVISELLNALDRTILLEYVANTFSSELIENSSNIYRMASLSNSKIFTLANNINNMPMAKTINSYLIFIHLDSAQVILILFIIFFIILTQRTISFTVNRYLRHKNIKKEDISYIQTHITKIFNIITSLIIIHLIIVVVIGFETSTVNISKVFAVLYVILTALLLYRITNTIAYLKIEGMKNSVILKNEVINLAIKVNNTLIVLLAVIIILKIVGVDMTALLSGLGIAGAAVAFAAKDSIANIFGSISILAGDIFEQGDWIQSKDADGTVVEIGLRATTIRTFDNALISVPNFELANSGVKNWTRRRIGRRIKMNIGVTYESDFDDIKKAIEAIREMLKAHPGIANEHTSFSSSDRQAKLVSIEDLKGIKRTTLVYMDEFADSSINILVYCFTRSVDWTEWIEVKEDVMYKIAGILKKNNLDFAYPTLTLHQAEKADELLSEYHKK